MENGVATINKEKLKVKNACTGKYQIYRKYWYTNGK